MYICVNFSYIFERYFLGDKRKLISKDNAILMGKKVGMSKSYLRTDPR